MAIKVKDLVKKLQAKNQNKEVEFVVVATNGELVCMDIALNAADLTRLLKMFKQGDADEGNATPALWQGALPDALGQVFSQSRIEAAVSDASDAFWGTIGHLFPEITSGDLGPVATERFEQACSEVVRQWITSNTREATHP